MSTSASTILTLAYGIHHKQTKWNSPKVDSSTLNVQCWSRGLVLRIQSLAYRLLRGQQAAARRRAWERARAWSYISVFVGAPTEWQTYSTIHFSRTRQQNESSLAVTPLSVSLISVACLAGQMASWMITVSLLVKYIDTDTLILAVSTAPPLLGLFHHCLSGIGCADDSSPSWLPSSIKLTYHMAGSLQCCNWRWKRMWVLCVGMTCGGLFIVRLDGYWL